MLQARPELTCVWRGRVNAGDAVPLHNVRYDFNDAVLLQALRCLPGWWEQGEAARQG